MLVAEERKVYQEPLLENKPAKKAVKKTSRAKRKLCILGAIAALFTFGVYYTSLSAVIASKGYELEQLKSEISRLETSNERMELTLASMSSLDKVEEIAVEKLGMSRPDITLASTALVASAGTQQADSNGEAGTAVEQNKNVLTSNNLYQAFMSFFVPGKAKASSGSD